MGFPGTWMTMSETMVYRVIPKCACSSIGQIMYFSDHGRFFDGDIHDDREGLHKWAREDSRAALIRNVQGETFTFTCVRNPWTRILSAFFDKIAGIQRNGRRYREGTLPKLLERYRIDVEDEFDQIAAFRRFLLFARDTIRFRKPMDPDIHWSAMSGHASTLAAGGGRYDAVIATEDFEAGMSRILAAVDTPHQIDLKNLPRFNESAGHAPARQHPIEDFFDDLSCHLVNEIYRRDFNLFNYDKHPYAGPPVKEIDLDFVHNRLAS